MLYMNNKTLPLTKETLIQAIHVGLVPKYVFFWGHQSNKSTVSKNCFSQWYSCPFTVDSILYPTAEHFMMAEKARLFNDKEILSKILVSEHPGEAKMLGRQVKHFEDEHWQRLRFEIAVKGNMAKFQQNKELGSFLLNTQNRILVEASPLDAIWGIGLSEDHVDATNPSLWPGLNLLGFALMETRSRLSK